MIREASASTKDNRGIGSLLPSPLVSLSYNSPSNNVTDKPIPISFSTTQFEQFENNFQDVNNMTTSAQNDCVIKDTMVSLNNNDDNTHTIKSPNVSPRNIPNTFHRSLPPPTLINAKVQDICRNITPMEIDIDAENINRKRALSFCQGKSGL